MNKKIFLSVFLIISSLSFCQDLTVTVTDPDSCLKPFPNSGTYTQNGTMNGKPMYINGANLRIIWENDLWNIQGNDPDTPEEDWLTGWTSAKNTVTPPAECWDTTIECSPVSLSGNDAYPVVNVNFRPSINISSDTGSTVTYTVTFDGTLNNLSASNFILITTGGITASINSVSQNSSNVWTVVVDWSGEGTVRLNLANDIGTSASIGCYYSTVTGQQFNSFTAPVTLVAGDIAFTGINSGNLIRQNEPLFMDDFSFIVLKAGGIPAGTKIFFTDNGFKNDTNKLATSEGAVLIEITSNVAQYEQVRITTPFNSNDPYRIYLPNETNISSNKIGLNMELVVNGDQVIAFQGSTKTPTFISAIHTNVESATSTLEGWDNYTGSNSPTKSHIPTGLTNGVNAIMVVDDDTVTTYKECQNAVFNCVGTDTSNLTATNINDRTKWTKTFTSEMIDLFALPATCQSLSNDTFELESKITIYPNPTNSILKIDIRELNSVEVKLFDNNGRRLKTQKLSLDNNTIDVSELSKGIYFLQITADNSVLNKTFIKE